MKITQDGTGILEEEISSLRLRIVELEGALNRYLSLRVANYDYATHFGGANYVFLRE